MVAGTLLKTGQMKQHGQSHRSSFLIATAFRPRRLQHFWCQCCLHLEQMTLMDDLSLVQQGHLVLSGTGVVGFFSLF